METETAQETFEHLWKKPSKMKECVEGYRRFFFEESEMGRTHRRDLLDSFAGLSNGIYFAPLYEIERYLVAMLFEERPERYTLHRRVETGDSVLLDTHDVPAFIEEQKKPPEQRDRGRECAREKYEMEVASILRSDVSHVIHTLQDAGLVYRSTGFGLCKAGLNRFRTGIPYAIDEKVLDSREKKAQLCKIFANEGIRELQASWLWSGTRGGRPFSFRTFIDESIEDILRGEIAAACSYRKDFCGVKMPESL